MRGVGIINKALKYLITLMLLICLAIFGCSNQRPGGEINIPPPGAREPEIEKIKITAVGDFLMHMPLIRTSYDPAANAYSFKKMFKEVEPLLKDSDFTIANLETTLSGPETGYSGYPIFNCPAQLAHDMKTMGIDMVSTANNHCLDKGLQGLTKTLDNLDAAGLKHLGTYRTPDEKNEPMLVDIKGIKVGFINYTQSTNGILVPSGSGHAVNIIKREDMLSEIQLLREKADIIVAILHFGTEYQRSPNDFQKILVRELFEGGVDIVLGGHVHVVQPMEWQTVLREGQESRCFVIYSLGNFVSNQTWRYSDCGIILNLYITRKPGEKARLESVDYVPVWVDSYPEGGKNLYRVLPVKEQPPEKEILSKSDQWRDIGLTQEDYYKLKEVWQDTTTLLGPQYTAPAGG